MTTPHGGCQEYEAYYENPRADTGAKQMNADSRGKEHPRGNGPDSRRPGMSDNVQGAFGKVKCGHGTSTDLFVMIFVC
jgi:hypothetical protein